jgi:glycine/D-amino acid oxidase-like deaminating enzyme
VPAIAKFFQSRGGAIITRCAARGFDLSAGRVTGVVTEKGLIKTSTAILSGGYWSSRFLHNHDIRFPQIGVVNSVQRTSALDIGHETTFSGNLFAVRKRLDGGFTVAHNHLSRAELTPSHLRFFTDFLPLLKLDWRGVKLRVGRRFIDEANLARRWTLDQQSPFEGVRILDPKPDQMILNQALAALKTVFPVFAPVSIEEKWAGMIDATPDAVPVIDRLEKIPGAFLASGFSGHGFGLGPGAGQLMAEIVLGKKTCVDPKPFRFSRFADGTKPQPSTGL